jgi:type II secretory pathway pseudopilin PulG
MVALVISSILMTVVFQMMSGQTRVVAVQTAREEVQQNVRGALEVVSAELRGAASGAILEATSQSITFMQPRAWGLLCDTYTAATTIDVLFPTSDALGAWAAVDGNGILINTATPPAATWTPNPHGVARAAIQSAVERGVPGPGNCNNLGATGLANTLQVVRLTSSVALTGARGNVVALYTLTRYDLGTVDSRLWLRRNNGMNGADFLPQPLAGPLEAGKFGFTYYGGTPAAAVAAPGTVAAQLDNLKMVRVQVVTNSTQAVNGRTQRDSGAVTVMLRN